MEFVINEWFPEYCKTDATEEQRKLLLDFLGIFLSKNDVLIIKKPSSFYNKLNTLTKHYRSHRDPKFYLLLKEIQKTILNDSNKVKYINHDIFLDGKILELLNKEGTNFSSDIYLFEAAFISDSKIIVTTDKKLVKLVSENENYKVIMLDNFMSTYKL